MFRLLAVQNSSIGDLVPCLVCLTELTIRVFTSLQSNPTHLCPLGNLIRVTRRHDLTKKDLPTYLPTYDYNTDNWEPGFVTWQLIVTLDRIRNSCDVSKHMLEFSITDFFLFYYWSLQHPQCRMSSSRWIPIMARDLLPLLQLKLLNSCLLLLLSPSHSPPVFLLRVDSSYRQSVTFPSSSLASLMLIPFIL